jgi:hypothetical protein
MVREMEASNANDNSETGASGQDHRRAREITMLNVHEDNRTFLHTLAERGSSVFGEKIIRRPLSYGKEIVVAAVAVIPPSRRPEFAKYEPLPGVRFPKRNLAPSR